MKDGVNTAQLPEREKREPGGRRAENLFVFYEHYVNSPRRVPRDDQLFEKDHDVIAGNAISAHMTTAAEQVL
jgi:hypothetical protein